MNDCAAFSVEASASVSSSSSESMSQLNSSVSSAIIRAFALSGVEVDVGFGVALLGVISMKRLSVCGVRRSVWGVGRPLSPANLMLLDGVWRRVSVSEWEFAIRTSLSLSSAASAHRKKPHF